MNSRVMIEYDTGVSRSSLASRPPENALAATKPVSRSELTSKGDSTTASGADFSEMVVLAGAVCADVRIVPNELRTKIPDSTRAMDKAGSFMVVINGGQPFKA